MSYKRLGNYIQHVNVRNKDLETEVLLGVSITKKLIPSIANVIGTDMSVYKIIEKRQFAYGTVTSRNGEKISIALSDQYDKALVSQIYVVFEVIDTEELLPEYLMMWFSRPEFDRYVRFHSHGSTRETFDWADMCEVELPIPSIQEQRQIVAQYQSIANKIKVNEQICEKLEAAAQALYKHWFVDFEFPNEAGKPYKSSGGKMVWNEELGKEIPEGWEDTAVGDIVEISGGGTPKTEIDEYWNGGDILWYSPTDLTKSNSIFSEDTDKKISKKGLKNSSAKLLPVGSVLMTSRATIGKVCFNEIESSTNQGFINILPNSILSKYFIYCWILDNLQTIYSLSSGSTFLEISKGNFNSIKFILSQDVKLYEKFHEQIKELFNLIKTLEFQNKKLTKLQSLLLSRLAVGEEVNA